MRENPLALAFRLLKGFGERGLEVWACHEKTERWAIENEPRRAMIAGRKPRADIAKRSRVNRIRRLTKAIAWLRDMAGNNRVRWRRLPVDPITFIEHDTYLNARGVLFDKILEHIGECNNGSYTEAVFTGAIGVGKTTMAIYSQAFQQYYLSCMEDPHETLGMDRASEIVTIFQSKNQNLAADIDYNRFRAILDRSPYFCTVFPYDTSLKSKVRFINALIEVKPVAGHDTAAIGANVIGGILDEVNFMAVTEDSKRKPGGEAGQHNQATANYTAIARRRESRFMRMGVVPGLLCIVSSRNYAGQFTDIKEEEAKTNPRIYIYDEVLWRLDPDRFSFAQGKPSEELVKLWGADSPLWFEVFIGDETRKPRILQPGEKVPLVDRERNLVRKVPQEYRAQFDNNILENLRDVAGVATMALSPFLIQTDKVTAAFGKAPSILSREDCDMVETRVKVFPGKVRSKEATRFAHVDLALRKDKCGVVMGYVSHFKRIERGVAVETLPNIVIDFALAIHPPRGGEIEFEAVRRLLYAMRHQGIPLKWITFDDYQSRDSLQILHNQGFTVGYQSMDTTTDPYALLRQAIYDGRVQIPSHPRLLSELVRLDYDAVHNKVNHPPNGSKDVADALAGCVYGLTMRREIWSAHGISTREVPSSVISAATPHRNSITAKERRGENPIDAIRKARYQDAA